MKKMDIPTEKIARRAWVKYQLELRGLSLADVARSLNVDRTTLYSVFHKPYPRMEKALADALDMAPEILWPERYR